MTPCVPADGRRASRFRHNDLGRTLSRGLRDGTGTLVRDPASTDRQFTPFTGRGLRKSPFRPEGPRLGYRPEEPKDVGQSTFVVGVIKIFFTVLDPRLLKSSDGKGQRTRNTSVLLTRPKVHFGPWCLWVLKDELRGTLDVRHPTRKFFVLRGDR